ncbi:MAG: CARDB domain-containing protein [Thermoplasmata archaeon]
MNPNPIFVCMLMLLSAWITPNQFMDVDLSVKNININYTDEIGYPGENITVKITFCSTTTNLQTEYVVCFNDNFYHGNLNFKNETEIVSLNFTLPNAGKYILRVVIDPQNEITETDETNNELTATVYSCDIFLALDFLKEKILSLPDAYFKPPAKQRKNALANKIDAAKNMLVAGNYSEFVDKMQNDIRAKMDGSGNNDWIINATAQEMLCKIIDKTLSQDYDNDSLGFEEEVSIGTDPFDPDTDNDLLCDGQEVKLFFTNPLDDDSDEDGIWDGYEVLALGTSPLVWDSDLDFLSDGLEIGLVQPQGNNTNMSLFVADTDPVTTTNPGDDDSDDDGIIDGNEDVNRNGQVDSGETNPGLTDTDDDGLSDGLEIGLAKAQGNGTPLSWQNDTDTNTTTDPLNPDTDNDGLLDGTEYADHNGRVDLYEPDPNDPDSDDDGILDGNKNTVTEIYLRKIVLAGYEITTGKFYAFVNKNSTLSPYSGYRVPEAGYWEFSGKSVNGTIEVNELVAVSFFMNTRIEIYEENVSNPIAYFQFCKNQSENFTLSNGNLLLEMESVLCVSGFADPNATSNDTDNDGINDYREVILVSAFYRDFRAPISENQTGMALADADFDGLLDGEEVDNYLSNPFSSDTDEDKLIDGYEAFTTQTISFFAFVPEPPVPYTINYTPSPYNLHDLNSTKAYVDVEVYGDLKNGYVEFTLWHERLSDLVVYMRPVNYPWQISWKVWNTNEPINGSATIKRDLFGTDATVEDIEPLLPEDYFYYWKDWEIIIYDMEKGCEGRLESVKLEFDVATKVVAEDTDNDGLSDGYETAEVAVLSFTYQFGTTQQSYFTNPISFYDELCNYKLSGKFEWKSTVSSASLKIYFWYMDANNHIHINQIWSFTAGDGGDRGTDNEGIERESFDIDLTQYMPGAIFDGATGFKLKFEGKNGVATGYVTFTMCYAYPSWGDFSVKYPGHYKLHYYVFCAGTSWWEIESTWIEVYLDGWLVHQGKYEGRNPFSLPMRVGEFDVEHPLLSGVHTITYTSTNPHFTVSLSSSFLDFFPKGMNRVKIDPNDPDVDDDGLKDGQEDLLMPTVYGSTIHTSNIVLHLPGAQSTMHARWEFRAHFSGANWEVPYKVYLDTITPQNEIKRNWLYLQDINPHTLIFVPQTQQDVSGWAVAHPGITNPFAYDSDQDYLTDWEECMIYFTNPTNGDSDSDGFGDCCECIGFVTDPWSYTQDGDWDGMPDEYEEYARSMGSWQDPIRHDKRIAILGAGSTADTNYAEFWNELIFLYDVLVWVYNYKPEDIHVCYPRGKPPSTQTMDSSYNLPRIYDMTRNDTSFVDPVHEGIVDHDFTSSTLSSLYTSISALSPSFVFSAYICHGSDDRLSGEGFILARQFATDLSILPSTTKQSILIFACKSGNFVANVIKWLSNSTLNNIGVIITSCKGSEYSFAVADRCSLQNAEKWWNDRCAESYNPSSQPEAFSWEKMCESYYNQYADRDCEGFETEFLYYFLSYLRKHHPDWGFFRQDHIGFSPSVNSLRVSLQLAFNYANQEDSFAQAGHLECKYFTFPIKVGVYVWANEHPQVAYTTSLHVFL